MDRLNTLIYLSVAALVAFFAKRFANRVGIPTVTSYVIVGVIMGISVLKIFQPQILNRLDIVNDFALGVIGFTIGSEFKRSTFQQLGKSIILIALFEASMAFIMVTIFITLMNPSKVYQALIMGAVASATAPAATVYVIQQYKTKGPLTSTILAVVGIDDAFALIIFVFAAGLAKSIMRAEHISILHILLSPIIDISLSIGLGILSGIVFSWLFKKVRYADDLLLGIASFILLILGISEKFHFSGLLAVMAFAMVCTNANPMLTNRSKKILDGISPILYAFFFIFAGAHLNVDLLPTIGFMGLVYFLSRAIGKMGGASFGAIIGKAPPTVKKYVGFALLPQVGVAIALAIIVKKEFGSGAYGETGVNLATLVINILLFTTIITEIVGPLLTKFALTKAGERPGS